MNAPSSLCLLSFNIFNLVSRKRELTPIVAARSTSYRNCKGKLLWGRVQEMGSGCADAKGWWVWWKRAEAAVRLTLQAFHQKDRGEICQGRNSPPGITAIPYVCTWQPVAQRSRSTAGKMKQAPTEAPQQMPTYTHAIYRHRHEWTHAWAQTLAHRCTESTWMRPLPAIWPSLVRLHATVTSTESRPDVPSVTCQGDKSNLELLRLYFAACSYCKGCSAYLIY